jgi:nitrite reductase/ring-hydroxylating ferredoxin subunit
VSNSTALALYAASLRNRRRGRRRRGVALGLAGLGALTGGGYLGSHLSYRFGQGVDQTTFDSEVPADWSDAAAAGDLRDEPLSVEVGDTPVLLARHAGGVLALHDRCSHRGCSLASGDVEDGAVTCSCHGSRFRLSDGELLRGPATSPQPAFDARERDGRIEIRARS